MAGTEVRFAVRITPRGGADRIEGVVDEALAVRVAAPPADGQANAALVKLIADALGVPKRDVRIASGATGRRKTIAVDGIDVARVREQWPGLTP